MPTASGGTRNCTAESPASKIGSSTIFTAASTTRSRTEGIDSGLLFARPRLGDEHPPRGQRTPPIRPQVLGQLTEEPVDTRTPRRRPRWSRQCPARRCCGAPRPTPATGHLCGRPCPAAHETVVPDRPWPTGKAHAARRGPDPPRTPASGGTSRIGTHRAPAFPDLRVNEAAALPSPQVVLSCGSIGTTTASDSLPAPDPLPGSTPVIGQALPRNPQCVSAGEGLPSSRRHRLNVPRPLTPRSPSRLHFQDLHRFHGLHREPPGSALPQCLTTRQASLPLRTAQLLPPRGFRRWASTRPVSRPSRQPATGPPGSYPDRTHTGRRRRASIRS